MTISSRYDHHRNHLHFLRQHTGDAPEPTAPIIGWGIEILRVGGIALFIGLLIFAADVLS